MIDSTPKLHELDLFERNGEKIRIIDRTAAFWDKVALRLLFEQHDIDRITRDCLQDCHSACQRMYSEWLDGNHRKPVSWKTLIIAFSEAEQQELADKLQIMFGIINQYTCQDNARQCKFVYI